MFWDVGIPLLGYTGGEPQTQISSLRFKLVSNSVVALAGHYRISLIVGVTDSRGISWSITSRIALFLVGG